MGSLTIDDDLSRLPSIGLYPALSAAQGPVPQPVDKHLLDEANSIHFALYADKTSTHEQRTAANDLVIKLGTPTYELPEAPPPWMATFQRTLQGIETKIGEVMTEVGAVKEEMRGMKGQLARMQHAQMQATTRARNQALSVLGLPMLKIEANLKPTGEQDDLPPGFNGSSEHTLKDCNERILNLAMDKYGLVLPGGRVLGDKPRKVRLLYIFLGGTDLALKNYE